MKRLMKPGVLMVFFIVVPVLASAGTFDKARDAFANNRPQEAVPLLELAVQEEPTNATARLWLAIGYEQIGKFDNAIRILQDMLTQGLGDPAVVLANLGNDYARKGDLAKAVDCFDQSIQKKLDYPVPYFNRAQAFVRQGKLADARSDYVKFLALAPSHGKAPEAKAMIGAIDEEAVALEKRQQEELTRQAELEKQKLADEARRKAEAEQRVKDEAARLADEARRKALLDSAFSGLNDAKDDSLTIGPGTEQVQQKENQFARED